jgi:hypothetical protein
MKALPRIIKAATPFQRTLWILALLVGLAAAIYQLAKLMLGYLEFATSVNIVTERSFPPFPDVTVCHMDINWTFRVLESDKMGENSLAQHIARIEKLQQNYSPDSHENLFLSSIITFPGYLQNAPEIHSRAEELEKNFIIDCYGAPDWARSPCFGDSGNIVNTTVFLDPVFGMCVTFHAISDALRSLDFILYLDDPEVSEPQDFNMAFDNNTHTSLVGARVVIHPPDSFPDIWLASQHVHAGVDMAFSVEATKRTLLDDPYGACVSREEAKEAELAGNIGAAINRHGYECYRMCAKDHISTDCNCIHLYFSTTKEERENIANRPLCGHVDTNISSTFARLECAYNTETALEKNFQEICPCPTACQQFTYEYTTKSIEWPHDIYHISFYEQYIHNRSYASKFSAYEELVDMSKVNPKEAVRKVRELDKIHKNFAQVRVLNHQDHYYHYSETPLISPEALFGNVGGLLNLWVGITFITIIEIIEFIHQLCKKDKNNEKQLQNGNGSSAPPDPCTDELLKKA